MTTASLTAPRLAGAPKLRLLPSGQRRRSEQRQTKTRNNDGRLAADGAPRAVAAEPSVAATPATASSTDAPVLVVGRDASRRSTTMRELARTMPAGTKFAHASALWEVLVLAGSSRMVILTGDLDDVPSASLMRMLSHRYPTLAVVALD